MFKNIFLFFCLCASSGWSWNVGRSIADNALLTRRCAAFCAMWRSPSEVLRTPRVSFVVRSSWRYAELVFEFPIDFIINEFNSECPPHARRHALRSSAGKYCVPKTIAALTYGDVSF